jgi:ParB-like chromosome segregation protein Spo0J
MLLPLDHLVPRADNANAMSPRLFRMLVAHLRESGRCPPVIVRPHPSIADRFEILDGHHRVRALREIGEKNAPCEVWHVDDGQAAMLLVTLNRLHGSDDPFRRGALLASLRDRLGAAALAARVPDAAAQVQRLIDLQMPPAPGARTPEDTTRSVVPPGSAEPRSAEPGSAHQGPSAEPIEPLTIFIPASQRRRVVERLRSFASDRAAALVAALGIEPTADEAAPAVRAKRAASTYRAASERTA